ncbi:MAG: NAD(P)H-dependent oxidoreductase subunit E [Chloroflexi bacterium]|nr:NAD(P)H-dependent oxidoreductase subunit E [Chloroflexota bacterium]
MTKAAVMQQRELRQQLIERFPRERTYLLPSLHYVQHEVGHLPEWALQVVGWHLHIPASEVYGAATSYSELRIAKPGERFVRVCTGLSCALNGALQVLDASRETLGVATGETAANGAATLEETACAFMCALAPVAQVDGRWHGRLDGAKMRRLCGATPKSAKTRSR